MIVIEPADPEFSIGLNVLEAQEGQQNYVQLAEFAQILKARWNLDSFGARTEELLRNSLHVLADNGLTLLGTFAAVNQRCLPRCVVSTEFRTPKYPSYFRTRFDTRSEAMQGVYRDAILNKVSGFTTDQRFRHILGQQRSTFSLLEAMDRGRWVILNLDKGRLGEQASTLGSLLLTKLKNALFARRRRQLFTLYADEIQNLVAYDGRPRHTSYRKRASSASALSPPTNSWNSTRRRCARQSWPSARTSSSSFQASMPTKSHPRSTAANDWPSF